MRADGKGVAETYIRGCIRFGWFGVGVFLYYYLKDSRVGITHLPSVLEGGLGFGLWELGEILGGGGY